LATTPEALRERLPFTHVASGCVITADARLDNRDELLTALGLRERAGTIGDGEIILSAYLTWDTSCVARFLGDFAFAIWDPRRHCLFCARDQFGMRPFTYHHTPGRLFVFASEPRAVLMQPRTPYRINEGRIADFLVGELEGIDKTSTFFSDVYRLPPAHTLTVSSKGVRVQRYWSLEPGPELRLSSDEAYAEAFLEVFTEAVRCRLRSVGPVGSMLSGGMDSGSIVAVARTLLAEAGQGPLPTFSAVGSEPSTCIETRTIQAALTMDGLAPTSIGVDDLDQLMPELDDASWVLDEPFDNQMTLLQAVYLVASRKGIKVMLDGAGGDTVFAEGNQLARLLRSGRWLTAYREALGQERFWGDAFPAWQELYRSARSAIVPNWVRQMRRQLAGSRRLERATCDSIISQEFARRTSLAARLKTLDGHSSALPLPCYSAERAKCIDHPFLTVGRERYDRVAASVGIEPRDPFLDRRVVAFCLTLPGEQLLGGGWQKIILRRAMAHRMPDAVRWRRGKEHLGWSFTAALIERTRERIRSNIETNAQLLAPYVDIDALRDARDRSGHGCDGDDECMENEFEAAHLAVWLNRHKQRPQAICELQSINLTNQEQSRSGVEEQGGQTKALTNAERQLSVRTSKRHAYVSKEQ
ncbi:MAG: asparagine synthase-related protein, partial [Hyphomicrobium sp.]